MPVYEAKMPKKYRAAAKGEVSTYRGQHCFSSHCLVQDRYEYPRAQMQEPEFSQ